jgi:hypothetical protein
MSILLVRRLLWSRTREWLLPIDYRRRETFAYACESYSRILELTRSGSERDGLLAELELGALPADSKVDHEGYVDILREAVAARNGSSGSSDAARRVARNLPNDKSLVEFGASAPA